MFVQNIFDLNAGDVFTAGNNDVFATIFDLNVAVGVAHTQVAGMKPAPGKSSFGGFCVTQITFHPHVAAQNDLTDGCAVTWHRLQSFWVKHIGASLQVITHALSGIEHGPVGDGQPIPVFLWCTHGAGAIDLSQTVYMGQRDTQGLHAFNQGRRWCGTRHHGLYAPAVQFAHAVFLQGVGCIDQHGVHDRRTTKMGHVVIANRTKHAFGGHLT